MKRSTRGFTSGAKNIAYAMGLQKTAALESMRLSANNKKAEMQGLKCAACLCCGNKHSEVCNSCDAGSK